MLVIWGPLFAWLHLLSKLTFPFAPLCSPWFGWGLCVCVWGGSLSVVNKWMGERRPGPRWPAGSCKLTKLLCVWSEWSETMGLGVENPSLAQCLAFKWHSTRWKKISSKGMRRKMCVTKQCLTQSSPPVPLSQLSFHFLLTCSSPSIPLRPWSLSQLKHDRCSSLHCHRQVERSN